jgi:type VI secretion system protein ImpC
VRRLEATWRGLRLLVDHCAKRSGVEIDVVNAGREAVVDVLGRLSAEDASRAPVDLLIVDQAIEPVAVDLARLEKWAGLAAGLLAPLVVSGHPSMLGVESLGQLARSTSALSTSDDGRAVVVRAVASREAARWVTIMLNDPLVRAAYTASTSRQQDPPFDEDPQDEGANVFAPGGYVVAALCARSYARLGWPTAITGARDGAIGDLPVHTSREQGHEAAIPLQVVPTEDAVREVARGGLTMLTCAPNSDAALLVRAPVLHRSGGGSGPTTSTLADQLFVGRFARAVQQVAAAIPADTEPRKAEEVARIALAELFENAPPSGPEILAKVDPARGALTITVRPRRFAGVSMEELTLGAALG